MNFKRTDCPQGARRRRRDGGRAGAPAIAQSRTKVKCRLPAHARRRRPALDRLTAWAPSRKDGLDIELVQFTTGLELFQAMIGGSLDMLATGAVISNFPARGQGGPS